MIAPLLLVAAGFAFLVITTSLVRRIARRHAAKVNVPVAMAFKGDARMLMDDNPVLLLAPFLITGGGVAGAVGCLWLMVVDYRVGVVAIALLVIGQIAAKRTAPKAI